jgi:tetratricopeptide (TPR) repeat protein
MSLLLDALQRASKEKEKLAESRASGHASEPNPAIVPAAPSGFPDLSMEHEALATVPTGRVSSGLALELEPVQLESDTNSGIEPNANLDVPQDLGMELSLDPIQDEPASKSDMLTSSLSEMPTGILLNAETHPPHTQFVPAVPAQNLSEGTPDATAEVSPQVNPVPPPFAASAAAADAARLAAQTHQVASANEPSPKIAREILAAKAKPPTRLSPRLIGLAIVVAVIAAINAAFFLGYFDRLLGTSDSVLGAGVAVAPPAPAGLPPPPSDALAMTQPPSGDVSPNEAATVAEATPAKDQSGPRTEKRVTGRTPAVTRGGLARADEGVDAAKPLPRKGRSAKPVIVARKASDNPLDSAYAALTEGRFDDAAAAYRLALEKNTSERDALLGLAYIAHRQGNSEEAKAHYQQVLRVDPGQVDALAGLLSLAADGDVAGAASRARDMAERSPQSAVALASLGGILVREGRIAEAQQAFFRALALEPESALHAYNLAVALDRMHKYAQAQTYYQRAISLAEKSSAAEISAFPRQQARQRLEQLRAAGSSADSQVASEARRN